MGGNSRRRRKSLAGSVVEGTEGSSFDYCFWFEGMGKAMKDTGEEGIIGVSRK